MEKITEDDLSADQLINTLWREKWKIVLFPILFVLIAFIYLNILTTNKAEISFDLKQAEQSAFIFLAPVQENIQENKNNTQLMLDSEFFFNKFVKEFRAYNVLSDVLKSQDYFTKSSEIQDALQSDKLKSFAKNSFTLHYPNTKLKPWTVKIKWPNVDDGKMIFDKTATIILEKIKLKIIDDIELMAKNYELENKDNIVKLQSDLIVLEKEILESKKNRIEALKIHDNLARDLNIKKFQRKSRLGSQDIVINMLPANNKGGEKNEDSPLGPSGIRGNETISTNYFLNGYEMISAEIKVLNGESNFNSLRRSSQYNTILQKIDFLKNNMIPKQLRGSKSIVLNADIKDWVSYDLSLAKVTGGNNAFFYLFMSFFGLIFGLLIIITSKALAKQKKL